MIPSVRLVWLAALPLVVSAVTPFEPALLQPMLALDGLVLGLALFDALLGRRRLVEVTRQVPQVLSVGRDNPITVEVRSIAQRTLALQIKDDLPDEAESNDLPVRLTLPPRGRATATYHIRPRQRGAYELGDQHVRYPTPLGLWQRQLRMAARHPVRVYPDVRAVRTYELLARQNRETIMARAARLRGGENEFERLRDYERDDAYRSIDWKATARRQRLTARTYQKERDQSIVCVLDCGRLMTAETASLTHLDHALNATLMLAHVAARTGDQVGLLAFDQQVRRFVPPTGGTGATARIVRAAYDLHPRLVESDHATAFETLARRVRKRSLIVLFTQVVDELAAATLLRLMRGLPGRHLPVCVLFRDDDLDGLLEAPLPQSLALDGPELHVRAAAAETVLWRERLARALGTGGALVLHTSPTRTTPALVNRYLEIKARQLL